MTQRIISLNEEEWQALVQVLDVAVRSSGLQAVPQAAIVLAIMQDVERATQSLLEEVTEVTDTREIDASKVEYPNEDTAIPTSEKLRD